MPQSPHRYAVVVSTMSCEFQYLDITIDGGTMVSNLRGLKASNTSGRRKTGSSTVIE